MGQTMRLTKTTMSLKQAVVLYVLYGIAAMLWAQRMPELVRRWGLLRDAGVGKETGTRLVFIRLRVFGAERSGCLRVVSFAFRSVFGSPCVAGPPDERCAPSRVHLPFV